MTLNLDRISKTVEKYMLDTISILRVTGTSYNPTTMVETDTKAVVYSGPGFVAPAGDPESTALGGLDVERIQYEVALPRTAPRILPNDIVQVVVSSDRSLVEAGDEFFVRDEIPTTFLTHRRLKVFKDTSAV